MINPRPVLPEEPTAVTPHGGFCGGKSQQWLRYPTKPHARICEGESRVAELTRPQLASGGGGAGRPGQGVKGSRACGYRWFDRLPSNAEFNVRTFHFAGRTPCTHISATGDARSVLFAVGLCDVRHSLVRGRPIRPTGARVRFSIAARRRHRLRDSTISPSFRGPQTASHRHRNHLRRKRHRFGAALNLRSAPIGTTVSRGSALTPGPGGLASRGVGGCARVCAPRPLRNPAQHGGTKAVL